MKDLKKISKPRLHPIFNGIEAMSNDLKGDVKHLTDSTPEYRLRIGDYRILFEIERKTK